MKCTILWACLSALLAFPGNAGEYARFSASVRGLRILRLRNACSDIMERIDGDVASLTMLEMSRKALGESGVFGAGKHRAGAKRDERAASGCKGAHMADAEYMSVGDLARRVGVTVRTVQYYDQQGLLAPSAKGPNNQRLYSEEDAALLYGILTLKYLGQSLTAIKDHRASMGDGENLKSLVVSQIQAVEDDLQTLLTRISTLRALYDDLDGAADAQVVDWEHLAALIKERQGEDSLFWQLTCIRDEGDGPAGAGTDGRGGSSAGESARRSESVTQWHGLIADAIRQMSADEPPTSPQNRSLAERYLRLSGEQGSARFEENLILMESKCPHAGRKDGSFDKLSRSVFGFLETLAQANVDLARSAEEPPAV
mgnify:CR=1 FL=1